MNKKIQRKNNIDAFYKPTAIPPKPSELSGFEQKEQKFSYKTQRSDYMREHPDEVLLAWQGPEYETSEKSAKWYTITGLVLAAIVLYAILTNSPVMAIVFVLIGVVGYLYVNTPPSVLDFGIVYTGIVVGNKLHHFDDIDSFWIFYEPPHTRVISFQMKGRFLPYIHVPLHQLDPVDVRASLLEFIPERRQEQDAIDTLERILHI